MFFFGGWNFQNLIFFEEEFDFGKRWERRQKELCVFHYLICMAWGVFFTARSLNIQICSQLV